MKIDLNVNVNVNVKKRFLVILTKKSDIRRGACRGVGFPFKNDIDFKKVKRVANRGEGGYNLHLPFGHVIPPSILYDYPPPSSWPSGPWIFFLAPVSFVRHEIYDPPPEVTPRGPGGPKGGSYKRGGSGWSTTESRTSVLKKGVGFGSTAYLACLGVWGGTSITIQSAQFSFLFDSIVALFVPVNRLILVWQCIISCIAWKICNLLGNVAIFLTFTENFHPKLHQNQDQK